MEYFTLGRALISLAIIGVAWVLGFEPLRRDDFRSRIRRIRDGLFDFVATNGFDYGAPAYVETRQFLNGVLRAANFLSVPALIVALVVWGRRSDQGCRLTDSLSRMGDGRFKAELQKEQDRAVGETLHFLFRQGACGIIFRCVLALFWMAGQSMKLNRWLVARGRNLVEATCDIGSPELPRWCRAVIS